MTAVQRWVLVDDVGVAIGRLHHLDLGQHDDAMFVASPSRTRNTGTTGAPLSMARRAGPGVVDAGRPKKSTKTP